MSQLVGLVIYQHTKILAMALKPDPSGIVRLIGDNTSELIQLFPGDLTNFPLGAWALDGEDVTLTYTFDLSQALQSFIPPAFSNGISGLSSGTLIRVRNSNAILGFVNDVTPNELLSRIVSVQGF